MSSADSGSESDTEPSVFKASKKPTDETLDEDDEDRIDEAFDELDSDDEVQNVVVEVGRRRNGQRLLFV